jgi:hypothetical protein
MLVPGDAMLRGPSNIERLSVPCLNFDERWTEFTRTASSSALHFIRGLSDTTGNSFACFSA